jgi:hypothetical protein
LIAHADPQMGKTMDVYATALIFGALALFSVAATVVLAILSYKRRRS